MKIIVALLVVLSVASCTQNKDASAFLEVGKKTILRDLNDPNSAQLRNLVVYASKNAQGEPWLVLCGEVNGKNLFGAYTGFKPFILNSKFPDKYIIETTPIRHCEGDVLLKE